jgi:hypothetical protein
MARSSLPQMSRAMASGDSTVSFGNRNHFSHSGYRHSSTTSESRSRNLTTIAVSGYEPSSRTSRSSLLTGSSRISRAVTGWLSWGSSSAKHASSKDSASGAHSDHASTSSENTYPLPGSAGMMWMGGLLLHRRLLARTAHHRRVIRGLRTKYHVVAMWVWIAIVAVAVVLLVIALFRARHGWTTTGGKPRPDGQVEARAEASKADLHRGPPTVGF